MDWAPPAVVWELPPPVKDELGVELGSLEAVEAAFAEPGLAASSLGSWADKCKGANAALAAAEAQIGKGCTGESTDGVITTAEDQLDEEDCEWQAALEAATAPLQPRPAAAVDQQPSKKKAPKQTPGPPPAKSAQRSPVAGPGDRPQKGLLPGGSPAAPAAPGGREMTRSRC